VWHHPGVCLLPPQKWIHFPYVWGLIDQNKNKINWNTLASVGIPEIRINVLENWIDNDCITRNTCHFYFKVLGLHCNLWSSVFCEYYCLQSVNIPAKLSGSPDTLVQRRSTIASFNTSTPHKSSPPVISTTGPISHSPGGDGRRLSPLQRPGPAQPQTLRDAAMFSALSQTNGQGIQRKFLYFHNMYTTSKVSVVIVNLTTFFMLQKMYDSMRFDVLTVVTEDYCILVCDTVYFNILVDSCQLFRGTFCLLQCSAAVLTWRYSRLHAVTS
jgi:hypothetical protein